MTTEYMLKQLITDGEAMRTTQKNYFSSKDAQAKKILLMESKKTEKEFDNALFNIKQLMK